MSSRFWVGGGSANTWAATGNTNWATSSGGSNNASVPGTGDVAIFDSNSGTGNSVIGASITVQSLECDGSSLGTGAYAGTLTHNNAVTLTLNTGQANTLRFSSSMTYSPASTSSIITLTHTSGTANTYLYGQKLAAFTVNGAGGTTQPLDTFLVNAVTSSILTVTSGIFDLNGGSGGPFACTASQISITGATTRSFIMGGTVTIGGNTNNATIWNAGTTTNLTFTKNSANIVIAAPTSPTVSAVTFTGGGLTYNNLTLNTTSTRQMLAFGGAAGITFAALAIGTGWNVTFSNNITYTISSAFTWAGSKTQPMLLMLANSIQQATLSVSSGSCTLSWGILLGVVGQGGATFTATNTEDLGLNSGWSISPPADATTTLTAADITTLNATLGAVAYGAVTTGSSTTSVTTSALTLAGVAASGVVANQFAGRTMLFTGNTTTAGLQGAAASITANTSSNTPTFTVGTLPATPASGDIFSVI